MTTDLLGAYPRLMRRGIFRGVDLGAMAAKLWTLRSMNGPDVHPGFTVPEFRWRAFSRGEAWGTAFVAFRHITLRIGVRCSIENAAEVVMHELVHCALPLNEHHGELFCRTLIAVAQEAFELQLDEASLLRLPALYGRRAYAIDDAITKAMKDAGVGQRLRSLYPAPGCKSALNDGTVEA